MSRKRIAVIVSHPIQHFCPQYASWANNDEISLKVFFASTIGFKKYIDPNFKTEVSWDNLHLDQFDHFFLNGGATLLSTKNLDAPDVEKELTIFNPDVVIIYGYFQKLQRRTYNWAIKNRVQIAYISDAEGRQKRHSGKKILKLFFLKYLFSKIQYFLTVGDANEDYYAKHGVKSEKFVRMHFPIDIKLYSESYLIKSDLKNEIRKQFNITSSEIVACVVGKLVSWKNQDHIIDAMLILETQNVFIHLFILGSGPMEEEWKQKAMLLKKSKVIFTGFVNPKELPLFYAASDMYIHPASVEPHSIAISEAIYMGCPIIISDRCGSFGDTDDVQEGKNGFVYPFGNTLKLAEMVRTLISDTNLRTQFGKYSHNIANGFQLKSHVTAINQIKNLIIDKNKKITF